MCRNMVDVRVETHFVSLLAHGDDDELYQDAEYVRDCTRESEHMTLHLTIINAMRTAV